MKLAVFMDELKDELDKLESKVNQYPPQDDGFSLTERTDRRKLRCLRETNAQLLKLRNYYGG